MIRPSRRVAISFLTLCTMLLFFCLPTYGRKRSLGTLASSSYGQYGQKSGWEFTAVATNPVNGISTSTETVCAGALSSVNPPGCNTTIVFLYQIQSDATNLVVTFSGLSRVPFVSGTGATFGFGILTCDPNPLDNPAIDPADNMLCTTTKQASSLGVGWDVLGGDLILTVPSVAATDTLTFYIAEQGAATDAGALPAPTISVGGLAVSPSALTFGSQESNTTPASQTLTIANPADFSTPLNVTNLATPNGFVAMDTCSALAPGDNCAVFLGFAPTAAGNLSGTLVVTDDSPSGSEVVTLNGNATAGGITLSPSTIVFGNQAVGTTSDPVSVTITNSLSNTQPWQIIGIPPSTPNPVTSTSDFQQTNTCVAPVPPGSSCSLQITFSPTVSGIVESSITLTDSSSDGSHTIVLSGNGTEVNTASASPSSLSFGPQTSGTQSAAQTVTITNNGAALTTVAANATAGFVVNDNCSPAGALSTGSTCTVDVAFAPPAGTYPYTGSLTIANDAIGGTLVIPLTGTSLAAPAAAPSFAPGAGTYTSVQTVTLSDAIAGATIYYTTDGTAPTTGSAVYSSPISVSGMQTINAIATAPNYLVSAVASAVYTINLPPPSLKIGGTAVTLNPGASTGNTSTITVTPVGGFTGPVTLTATITSSPNGATDPPLLSFGSTSPVSIIGPAAATATLTITSTSSTVSALPLPSRDSNRWLEAGGLSLAFAGMFMVRRPWRKWQFMLGLFFILLAMTNGIVACGGGGGGGGQPSVATSGTTAGAYTITVTGTSGSLSQTGTIALTVN